MDRKHRVQFVLLSRYPPSIIHGEMFCLGKQVVAITLRKNQRKLKGRREGWFTPSALIHPSNLQLLKENRLYTDVSWEPSGPMSTCSGVYHPPAFLLFLHFSVFSRTVDAEFHVFFFLSGESISNRCWIVFLHNPNIQMLAMDLHFFHGHRYCICIINLSY